MVMVTVTVDWWRRSNLRRGSGMPTFAATASVAELRFTGRGGRTGTASAREGLPNMSKSQSCRSHVCSACSRQFSTFDFWQLARVYTLTCNNCSNVRLRGKPNIGIYRSYANILQEKHRGSCSALQASQSYRKPTRQRAILPSGTIYAVLHHFVLKQRFR
jgi:hypothetical protein